MARLGPWPGTRRIAVAVSGGADSLCLALLAAGWGNPLALIVDHGLRAGTAAEAEQAARTLASFGVESRILRRLDLKPGPGLQARARAARYAALHAACRAQHLQDLLLGHHAGDQAETLLLRREGASGAAGLAGMAALTEGAGVRQIRPLLSLHPDRLRATLATRGIRWAEDPSNQDPAFSRVRLRQGMAMETSGPMALAGEAYCHGVARAGEDQRIAAFLARHAVIRPEGFAILGPVPFGAAALAALMRALGGAGFKPRSAPLAALCHPAASGTLAGLRLLSAGRLGPGRLLLREMAALGPPVTLRDGAVWDRRFTVAADAPLPPGLTLGALGADAARLRRFSPLPACVLQTLPAIRLGPRLVSVPHVPAAGEWTKPAVRLRLVPLHPASGAPFLPMPDPRG